MKAPTSIMQTRIHTVSRPKKYRIRSALMSIAVNAAFLMLLGMQMGWRGAL